MHGISHLGPEDVTAAPPPTHHGIRAAIGAHPLAAKWREEPAPSGSRGGSMESIIRGLEEERRGVQAKAAKPIRPPSKPPSSASSLLDLSQPHIRLSPLQVKSLHSHPNSVASIFHSICGFLCDLLSHSIYRPLYFQMGISLKKCKKTKCTKSFAKVRGPPESN